MNKGVEIEGYIPYAAQNSKVLTHPKLMEG